MDDNDLLREHHRRFVDEWLRSARAKMIAKKLISETARRSAAFRTRSEQLSFAYARLVIGYLPLDRRVMGAATAKPILHAASHTAFVCRLSREREGRREGSDQQKERRTERAQSC